MKKEFGVNPFETEYSCIVYGPAVYKYEQDHKKRLRSLNDLINSTVDSLASRSPNFEQKAFIHTIQFQRLLVGELPLHQIEKLNECHLEVNQKSFVVILADINYGDDFDYNMFSDYFADFICYYVEDLVRQCHGKRFDLYLTKMNYLISGILCFDKSGENSESTSSIREALNGIISTIKDSFGLSMRIAFSDIHDNLVEVRDAYFEANKARDFFAMNPVNGESIMQYNASLKNIDMINHRFEIMTIERQFKFFILNNQFIYAKSYIKMLLGYYKHVDTIEQLRYHLIGVINMVVNCLSSKGDNEIVNILAKMNTISKIMESNTTSELQNLLLEIMDRVIEYQNDNHCLPVNEKLEQIEDFIRCHFNDYNLCIKQIAEKFSISVPYLSKVFREKNGCGLLDYITLYRIDKAKCVLLQQNNVDIHDIANQIGFSSCQTFIRVFKKYEGLTPGQFRDRHMNAKHSCMKTISASGLKESLAE